MIENQNLGRITESRIDLPWGRPAKKVRNLTWFNKRTFTTAKLSTGLSTERQWYAYDSTAMIVKGHCAYQPIANALAAEGLVPVRTSDERAIVSIWFNQLRDSVCGTYHEIVMSIDSAISGEDSKAGFSSTGNPFHYLYNQLGGSVCKQQFLHSLYINSPLSIAWGREMQAFPKHPLPVDSQLNDGKHSFEAKLAWDSDLIAQATIRKRWGLRASLAEGLGLVTTARLSDVARFLNASEIEVPIQMPRRTASRYDVPTNYLAFIRKGKNPAAIRCWPWHDDDTLELGRVRKSTDCEDHNGHLLFQAADFRPKVVSYIPFMQAYVGTAT
ncbi:MAG: hypothetical protein P1U77_24915 [Rubripirellula sp.]|nr:hypothetical protein [Rubripirellula sp.]